MNDLLKIIDSLNITKVALASYLGVSRQMVYNYLSLDSIDEWPIDKRIKILDLFDVQNSQEIKDIKIDSEMYLRIQDTLQATEQQQKASLSNLNITSLDSQLLVSDIIKLLEMNDPLLNNHLKIMLTLIESSQLNTQYAFLIEFIGKLLGKVEVNDFAYNTDEQTAYEAILYSALQLYKSQNYSKTKIKQLHEQFIEEQNQKNEAIYEETNVLNITKMMALRELGFNRIDTDNADLVLNKMAEIRSRKI